MSADSSARAPRRAAWLRLVLPLLLLALAVARALTHPVPLGLDLAGGMDVVYRIESQDPADRAATAAILEQRLQLSEVAGAAVRLQAEDQVRVQVPCRDEAACGRLRRSLEMVDLLTLHEVLAAAPSPVELPVGPGTVARPMAVPPGGPGPAGWLLLRQQPALTGASLREVQVGFEPVTGSPVVELATTTRGAEDLRQASRRLAGRRVAVVLGGEVVTAAVMEGEIAGGRAMLRGRFDVQEARRLTGLMGAGALPAPLTRLASSSVGPTLGAASVGASLRAAAGGMVAVAAFMTARYRLAGLLASVGLGMNLAMQLAVLEGLGATLTLPGLAGVVLTVGMAVDASVLTFERVREELAAGRRGAVAIARGFGGARSAVLDSNATTFLTALVLYLFGSGPVRGFAVTLSVGLVTSLVAALWAVRVMLEVAHEALPASWGARREVWLLPPA